MSRLRRFARRLTLTPLVAVVVVVGTLLVPQPAQAQTPTTTLTTIAGNGKVTLSWTAENVGATYSGPPPCTNYAWSKWQYKQKTGSGTFGSPIDISTTRSTRSHEVTGLMNGTVYEFIVQARYDCTTADTFILVGLSDATTATPTTKIITLSTASTTITEGDSNKDVSITVTLSEAAPEGGMIVYLEPGDAGTVVVPDDLTCTNNLPAGTDVCFVDANAEVAFAEGDTQKTATIRILGDTTDERDETLMILGSAGAGDGSSTLDEWSVQPLTITITDDDGAIVAPVLTGATSTTSQQINFTWTHAGSSVGDYISGAARMWQWESSHRLKGTSSWTVNENGGPSVAGGTARRTAAARLGVCRI